MSVKKIILTAGVIASAVGASAAMAGGPDNVAMPVTPAFQPNVYVEVHAGYADANWNRFRGIYNTAALGHDPRGGFTFGGDIGYQFMRNLGVEVGAFYLPRVSGTTGATPVGTTIPAGVGNRTTSWFAYAAGKLTVPVYDNLDVYGKLGAAYRRLDNNGAGVPNNGYWTPVFGAGIEYMATQNVSVSAQYMRLPGYAAAATSNARAVRRSPAADLYTLAVGYKFAV